jgi:molybdopterin/thiamine biosynthesis adenylyltransferase
MEGGVVSTISQEELTRYQRQIMIPEIGEAGQRKLREACVFLAGMGGLGSITAYYLVAAGIGRLRLADNDRVSLVNLNRQLLHTTGDIGKTKATSAADKLTRLNPHCRVESFHASIDDGSIDRLLEGCDMIVDGTDNLKTRRVLNRASLRKGLPYLFGGVHGFNGMVTTFVPGQTGCLECLFPERTVIETQPGVLGPAPGLIGSIQTMEALKLIVGFGQLLKGRLLYFRGFDISFKEVSLEKNPDCPVCGS